MSPNKNCFVFIQVMKRRRRGDGFLIFQNRHWSPSDVAPAPGANETWWSEWM
jgi:hypothetical protein